MHQAIERFTGKQLQPEFIQANINSPTNAINVETNAHHSMDKSLAWGIEAKMVDDKVRVMSLCSVADLI